VLRFLGTANVASSPILATLLMEAIRSSEKLVPARAIRPHTLEDGILHERREKFCFETRRFTSEDVCDSAKYWKCKDVLVNSSLLLESTPSFQSVSLLLLCFYVEIDHCIMIERK
jgi:hypothetical protein